MPRADSGTSHEAPHFLIALIDTLMKYHNIVIMKLVEVMFYHTCFFADDLSR